MARGHSATTAAERSFDWRRQAGVGCRQQTSRRINDRRTDREGIGHASHEPAIGDLRDPGLDGYRVLAAPHIAEATATTATVWQVQGFVPEEDEAFRKTVADYEKASGNKIDLSVMPFMALNQKAISALTSGVVPDLIFHDAPATILPQNAWEDRLVDVSDVVELHRSNLSETALLNSTFYNRATKRRASTWLRSSRPASRSISGAIWSPRPASSYPMRRKRGMPSGISSNRCRRNCAPREGASCTPWACR